MSRRWAAALGLLAVLALLVGAWAHHMVTPPALGPATLPSPQRAVATPSPVAPSSRRAVRARTVRLALPPVQFASTDAAAMPVSGAPSVDATTIDGVLRRENSPLAGLGAFIGAAGRRWGIDPVYLLAFVSYFDSGSTLPVSAHNVGHIRAAAGQSALEGYRMFPTWRAGIDGWYRLIRDLYGRRWGLRTLDSIVPVYAPGVGRRSVEAELNSLRAMVTALRAMSKAGR